MGANADRREVVVVGGGQAGLAIGYFLKQQGRDFTILEAAHVVGRGVASGSRREGAGVSRPDERRRLSAPASARA